MPTREIKRTPAFFPINIPEDASSDSSASPRDLSPLVSGTAQIVTVLASPTTDQDTSDETPDSRVGFIDKDSQDMEQLKYQYRPMTLGEKEIMRINEDVIYQSWKKLLSANSLQSPCRGSLLRFRVRRTHERYSRTWYSSSSLPSPREHFNSRSS